MKNAILNFNQQFGFEPQLVYGEKLAGKRFSRFVVCGMGGSHLAGDLLKVWNPSLRVLIHSDYNLPYEALEKNCLVNTLFIASSYSGNTEETLDAFQRALELGLPVAAVAVGGKLLELAKKNKIPYVQLPDTGVQPRSALGFSFRALLKLLGEEEVLQETGRLLKSLKPKKYEVVGKELAKLLKDKVPVIYSSNRNSPIAYNWKIKFNETGKIPAFLNVFPELNHNEMTGFDVMDSSRHLSEKFYFILLKDHTDHPQVIKRMNVLEKLYLDRGLPVYSVDLDGSLPVFEKIFNSLILADWAAYYIAEQYGLDPEQVPMVEEFKKLVGR